MSKGNARFQSILKKSLSNPIEAADALYLFEHTNDPLNALDLFRTSRFITDAHKGRLFQLDGYIGLVNPCNIVPRCKYCVLASKDKKVTKWANTVLTLEQIVLGARLIRASGIEDVKVTGGTDPRGEGDWLLPLSKELSALGMRPAVNVGQGISASTLKSLKKNGVEEIYSSLETTNVHLFKELKPGDSLDDRTAFASAIASNAMSINTVLLMGFGYKPSDYIEHLYKVQAMKGLSGLSIAYFSPQPGTPMESSKPVSAFDVARLTAIARLVLPTIDISAAWPGADSLLPYGSAESFLERTKMVQFFAAAGANRTVGPAAVVYADPGVKLRISYSEVIQRDGICFIDLVPLLSEYLSQSSLKLKLAR